MPRSRGRRVVFFFCKAATVQAFRRQSRQVQAAQGSARQCKAAQLISHMPASGSTFCKKVK
eukprot:15300361-Alexandrium_andersonii.AAC.1